MTIKCLHQLVFIIYKHINSKYRPARKKPILILPDSYTFGYAESKNNNKTVTPFVNI